MEATSEEIKKHVHEQWTEAARLVAANPFVQALQRINVVLEKLEIVNYQNTVEDFIRYDREIAKKGFSETNLRRWFGAADDVDYCTFQAYLATVQNRLSFECIVDRSWAHVLIENDNDAEIFGVLRSKTDPAGLSYTVSLMASEKGFALSVYPLGLAVKSGDDVAPYVRESFSFHDEETDKKLTHIFVRIMGEFKALLEAPYFASAPAVPRTVESAQPKIR